MARVRIKICGITRRQDAEAAADLGVDYVGLNFYEESPRCVSTSQAKEIIATLPSATQAVGLVVNRPWDETWRLAADLSLSFVQIYGSHDTAPPDAALAIIPAFAVRDEQSLRHIERYLALLRGAGIAPAAVLVDAHVPGLHGGTGRTAPWDLLADFDCGVPLLLAGGLTPENVAQAVRKVRPWGVDVASGVEASPGVKDREKMKRFAAEALSS